MDGSAGINGRELEEQQHDDVVVIVGLLPSELLSERAI